MIGEITVVVRDPQVMGGSVQRGPIGLDDDSVEARAPLQLKGGGKEKPPKVAAIELNVVADFPNPYGGLAKEVQAIKDGRWGPTIDDFNAVVTNGLQCDSFARFGAAILFSAQGKERPPKSVRRVNVFTHSNPDLIAFKGTVKPLSLGVDVLLEVASGLNSSVLQTWNGQGFFLEDPKTNKKYTLDAIRARFTGKDTEIWLYACHSGVDGTLVQEIADTFQVSVIGFRDAIAYCPSFTESPLSIDRKHIGIKTCSNSTTDFRTLSAGTVRKTP